MIWISPPGIRKSAQTNSHLQDQASNLKSNITSAGYKATRPESASGGYRIQPSLEDSIGATENSATE
ncbi:hypothetical protein DSO57_1033168 [Entomophthora muscae]|uniref:Uncharacterized protein n=1 Tax=Entomophthora muscae TaxID=34485 RepID=A0ACC2TB68_9FUNG|nr:hypothetical protein DSO57_1033168 [Entomophthora muscae]